MSSSETPFRHFVHAIFERRGDIWAILLYGLLLFVTIHFLLGTSLSWLFRLGLIVLAAVYVCLDWLVIHQHSDWHERPDRMIPSLLGLLVVSTGLTRLEHHFILLFLIVCAYAFRYLPIRWGLLIGSTAILLVIGQQFLLTPTSPGSLFQAISSNTWLFFGILVAGWVAQLTRVSRERQDMIEKLQATQGKLSAAERQAGALEERARLAHEIHDTLAQGLAGIVMHLEAAEAALGVDTPMTRQHLDQARRSARENLSEARRFVWALRPETLELHSLEEALRRASQRWSQDSRVSVEFITTGTPSNLPPETEVTLLRVAQETLNNVHKHAQASRVTITLSYMDDLVSLDVQDNGRGFHPNGAPASTILKGFGLAGMRERVQSQGGTMNVESEVGEGTTVVVELPLNPPPLKASLEKAGHE